MKLDDIGKHNETLARKLIEELVKGGVRTFCINPGSRNTPLIVAAAEHPLTDCPCHFDERTLGFFALGIAKAQKNPVCLICTSGSALVNYYPAIVEASLSHVPLIILAADRPFELRDIGANQTVDQVKCFGSHLRWESDIPLSDPLITEAHIGSIAAHALFSAKLSPGGPVLLNCMIREPFRPKDSEALSIGSPFPQVHHFHTTPTINEKDLSTLQKELLSYEKGIIIAGAMDSSEEIESIFSLAMQLGWPIFAGPLSDLRSIGRDATTIPFYNHILENTLAKEKMQPEAIIHFGKQFISKSVMEWLSKAPLKKFIHVSNFSERYDPLYRVTDRIIMEPALFAAQILSSLPGKPPSIWLSLWKEYSLNIEEQINTFFEEEKGLTPLHVFQILQNKAFEDSAYFFSTSLPIRYADSFFFPKDRHLSSFSTRGVSGIDGSMGVPCGLAHGMGKRVIAVIGDLSFFYGMNALSLLKKNKAPVTFILLNNGGGGLFEHLPIKEKKEIFESHIKQAHSLRASSFAAGFDLPYFAPSSLDELEKLLKEDQGSSIIEINIESEKEYNLFQKLNTFLKKQLMHKQKDKQLRYRVDKKNEK